MWEGGNTQTWTQADWIQKIEEGLAVIWSTIVWWLEESNQGNDTQKEEAKEWQNCSYAQIGWNEEGKEIDLTIIEKNGDGKWSDEGTERR